MYHLNSQERIKEKETEVSGEGVGRGREGKEEASREKRRGGDRKKTEMNTLN